MFFIVKLIDIYTPQTWIMLFIEVTIGMVVYLIFLVLFRTSLINQVFSMLDIR